MAAILKISRGWRYFISNSTPFASGFRWVWVKWKVQETLTGTYFLIYDFIRIYGFFHDWISLNGKN